MSDLPTRNHRIRGLVTILLFGPPMIFFGFNAAYALAHQFIAGWIPSQWFSDNAADWFFAMGTQGGASDYVVFMVNGILTYGCWWAIRWGYTSKTK